MIKDNIRAFVVRDFSDKDTCTIAIENMRRVVYIMSRYMTHGQWSVFQTPEAEQLQYPFSFDSCHSF